MKALYLILALFFSNQLLSQYYSIDLDVNQIDTTACTSDPSVEIFSYKDWEIYHTDDDLWDGTKDNSECISLKLQESSGNSYYGIDFSTINPAKPIFLRYKTESLSTPLVLIENSLAAFSGSLRNPDDVTLELGDFCTDKLCSGIITVLNVEDAGNTYQRVNTFQFSEANVCDVRECFVTEKINNTLVELIYKFTLAPGASTDNATIPNPMYYEESGGTEIISNDLFISENFNTGSSYDVGISDIGSGWSGIYLTLHNEPGLPLASNPSFIDIAPQQANATAQTINLSISEWENIYFQSNTSLQGGLVEGSTTERHELNIINNSEGLCLFIVELTFGGSTNFVHQGGALHFSQTNSCFQFRNGSELIIGADQQLNYGNDGTGMLLIRSGSSIVFEKNAHLNFNGGLVFDHFVEYQGAQDIDIYLPKGSNWVFGPEAWVKKINADQQINIHMTGGEIDLSNLSLEDQAKLNLIYPSIDEEIGASIYPNPVSEQLNLDFSKPLQTDLHLRLNTISGGSLRQFKVKEGESSYLLSLGDIPNGIYLVQISNAEINETKKIVIQH